MSCSHRIALVSGSTERCSTMLEASGLSEVPVPLPRKRRVRRDCSSTRSTVYGRISIEIDEAKTDLADGRCRRGATRRRCGDSLDRAH